MGKRSRPVSENYEHIAHKFKKLERKLIRARRRNRRSTSPESSSDSSSSCTSSTSSSASSRSRSRSRSARRPTNIAPDLLYNEDLPNAAADVNIDLATSNGTSEPQPSTSTAAIAELPQLPLAELPPLPPAEIDGELLKILGEDPSLIKVYGMNIHSDLAIRLQHVATTGLTKEERKELLERYLPPANCTLIDAPILNPEVKAAISETVFKRDKGIELRQKQTSTATSCLAEALTLLISSEPKNTKLIKLLMDAVKLLCDNQFSDSVTRRNFVLYNLKKELKDQLQATKIDKFLFSEELSEALKAAKAISKSGADLKSTSTKKQTKNVNKPHQKNLNWRGPPPSQRPKGNQRTKGPTFNHKNRQENSSKQSSRHERNRNHRR